MQSSIKLTSVVEEAIRIHGEQAFPNECCGFLFGNETDGRVINLSTRVENSKEGDQRRRFEISPFDYMKAEQFAIENETTLLGIYHSHPNHPAIASVHDLAKAMPYFSYVIVSIMDGKYDDIKSWKLYDEKREFHEEQVLISKSITQ
jgi:proteasome lid subunit RPN8/RPN11